MVGGVARLPSVIQQERESWSYAKGRFPIERTGALEKTKTPTPEYALDNAVVVIEGMTRADGANADP